MKLGAQLWPQQTSWHDLAAAGAAVDRAGFDSIWTWDHLLSARGDPDRPIYEGWLVAAALAATTSHATIGLLVGANTLRNPGLTAKLAATLDHISDGRAVLGIGSGWLEPEHTAHGLDFGASFGERLDRLEEAVLIIRALLDGEEVTQHGRFYDFTGAHHLPGPLQPHLPMLIGGAGPKKTLRIVGQYADMWNSHGPPAALAARDAILRAHCEALGRDPATIERTCGASIVIRDDPAEAHRVLMAQITPYGSGIDEVWPALVGPPELVAEGLSAFADIGFHHVITSLQAPFDFETIERIGEVRRLVDGGSR